MNEFIKDPEFNNIVKELELENMRAKEAEQNDDALKLIKLSTLFAYEILRKVRNTDAFLNWIRILKSLYFKHVPACLWFLNYLTANPVILEEIILEAKDYRIRENFANLIKHILDTACEVE